MNNGSRDDTFEKEKMQKINECLVETNTFLNNMCAELNNRFSKLSLLN
jgi:hypothetical protein